MARRRRRTSPPQLKVSAAYHARSRIPPGSRVAVGKYRPGDRRADQFAAADAWRRRGCRLTSTGDPRFGIPAGAILAQRNFAEAKAALAPVIADAPIEITIVGDIDEAAAIAAVAAELRRIDRAQARCPTVTCKHAPSPSAATARPSCSSMTAPPTRRWSKPCGRLTDDSNYREVVGLEMLKRRARPYADGERPREPWQQLRACRCRASMSTAYTGFGYIAASRGRRPGQGRRGRESDSRKPLPSFATSRSTADLLARARAPELEGARPRSARQRLLA